jgi:hypothetical protein
VQEYLLGEGYVPPQNVTTNIPGHTTAVIHRSKPLKNIKAMLRGLITHQLAVVAVTRNVINIINTTRQVTTRPSIVIRNSVCVVAGVAVIVAFVLGKKAARFKTREAESRPISLS